VSTAEGAPSGRGLIERYREWLPVSDKTPIVTLYEGGTPLVPAPGLSERLGASVYLKFEGLNPTGSFKDRGMTVAISKALERGSKAVVCASTGNTSASAAAYAARAGITSAVLVPGGGVALGKLSQAVAHGARVIPLEGNFDDALSVARELADRYAVQLVNSLNPDRIEGQKTVSFEICDQLGDAPDIHALPVGNAGNITASWRGYTDYLSHGRISQPPALWGFQAEGAAPLVRGEPVEHPETVATAIRIGNPASWGGAVRAATESEGGIWAVSDAEILEAQRVLASTEGVFCEPASAAPVAGIIKRGVPRGSVVVCVLTGHGLKDPEAVLGLVSLPQALAPDAGEVAGFLGL
jgi:threonine synthase